VKLLFLKHRLPYATNRGDRIRAYHLLKALGRFAEVTLVSLVHDAEEAGHVVDLARVVHEVHAVPVTPWRNKLRALSAMATGRPLTHVLLDGPTLIETVEAAARARPALVFAYRPAWRASHACLRSRTSRCPRHGGRGFGRWATLASRAVADVRHLRASRGPAAVRG
jgi:hypothetical protein